MTETLDAGDLVKLAERPLTLHHIPGLGTVALLHPSGDRPGLLARNVRHGWICVATDVFSGQLAVRPAGSSGSYAAYELLTTDDLDAGAREDLHTVIGENRLPEAISAIAEQVAAALTAGAGRPVEVRVPDDSLGEVTIHPASQATSPDTARDATRARPRPHDRWL